jgi:hypothetical protein
MMYGNVANVRRQEQKFRLTKDINIAGLISGQKGGKRSVVPRAVCVTRAAMCQTYT